MISVVRRDGSEVEAPEPQTVIWSSQSAPTTGWP
jgi:hypothetical protein